MIGSAIQQNYQTIINRGRAQCEVKKAEVANRPCVDSEEMKSLKATIVEAVQRSDFAQISELSLALLKLQKKEVSLQEMKKEEEKKQLENDFGLFVSRCKTIKKILTNLPRPLNMIIMLDAAGFGLIIQEMGDLAYVEEARATIGAEDEEKFDTFLYILGQKNGQPDDEEEQDEEEEEKEEEKEEKDPQGKEKILPLVDQNKYEKNM